MQEHLIVLVLCDGKRRIVHSKDAKCFHALDYRLCKKKIIHFVSVPSRNICTAFLILRVGKGMGVLSWSLLGSCVRIYMEAIFKVISCALF